MLTSRNQWTLAAALVLPLFAASLAFSQQAGSPRARARTPRAGGAQASPANPASQGIQDAMIAGMLAIGNEEEIALAKLAQKHAESAEVKQFAEQMEQDHTQMLQKLQQFTGGISSGGLTETLNPSSTLRGQSDDPSGASDASGSGANGSDASDPSANGASGTSGSSAAGSDDQSGTGTSGAAGTRSTTRRPRASGTQSSSAAASGSAPASGQMDFLSIKREISQECLRNTTEELQAKQGAEFDKCYVNGQVVMHIQMVSALKVLKNHVSSQLQQELEQGQQTAQQHLDHAKQLAQTLDQAQAGASESSSSPASGTRSRTGRSRTGRSSAGSSDASDPSSGIGSSGSSDSSSSDAGGLDDSGSSGTSGSAGSGAGNSDLPDSEAPDSSDADLSSGATEDDSNEE